MTSSQEIGSAPIPCSERMPPPREYVLMWETPSLRWSVGCWVPEYQQWGNRDDPEYAIHPHQVSHWMPLPEPIKSEEDGAPYCPYGHKTKAACDCEPIARNE